jgi:chemotaxis signal transduction protein
VQVLVFRVGGDPYALPVERVREVVAYRAPRRLPAAAPWERGVVPVRDELLRVWDLAVRLGVRGADDDTAFVVVDGAEPVALAVGAVLGIRDIPDGREIVETVDGLVVVLDADSLLGAPSRDLSAVSKRELQQLAREAGIKGRSTMTREQLLEALR